MSVSLSQNAIYLLNKSFSSSVSSSLQSAAAVSPYFAGMLNAYAQNPFNSIVMGDAGAGTQSAKNAFNSQITIDPTWVPDSGSDAEESSYVFATTLAHELGHMLSPSGYDTSPATTLTGAIANGETEEGVAVTNEYIVAQQLGLTGVGTAGDMHSDSSNILTPQLDQIAAQQGVGVGQLTFGSAAAASLIGPGTAAEIAGGTFYGGLNPSGAPNFTYDQLNGDEWIISNTTNLNPLNIDWQKATPAELQYNAAPSGELYVDATGLPLLTNGNGSGTVQINSTISQTGGPISLAETVDDGSIQYSRSETTGLNGALIISVSGVGDVETENNSNLSLSSNSPISLAGQNDLISDVSGGSISLLGNGAGDVLSFSNQNISLAGADSVLIGTTTSTVNYGEVSAQNGTVSVTTIINSSGTGTATTTQADGTTNSQTFATTAQEFGQVGAAFGSSLGRILAGNNAFAQIGASTVLGALGNQLAAAIGVLGDGADMTTTLDTFLDGDQTGPAGSVIGTGGFLDNLEGQGVGAVSSYLVGELLSAIGITGAPAQIVNSIAGQEVAQVANNIISGGVSNWSSGLGNIDFYNIAAGFVGSELGDLVYATSTPQGAEGASVGGAVGGVVGAEAIGDAIFGVAIPGVGVLLGTFVGDIIGGLIGDLFGQASTSHIAGAQFVAQITAGSPLTFTYTTQYYQVDPGSQEYQDPTSIGNAISQSLDTILAAVGGTVTNASQLTQFTVKVNTDASSSNADYYGNTISSSTGGIAYYYEDSTNPANQYWAQYTTLTQVMDYAEARELSEMVFSGGDPYIERAIDAGLRSAVDPSYSVVNNTAINTIRGPEMSTIDGYIQIAKDYETYEANKTVINAMMAAEPNSDFTAGWIAELSIAAQLGFGTSVQGGPWNDTLRAMTLKNGLSNTVDKNVLIGGGGTDTYDYYAGSTNNIAGGSNAEGFYAAGSSVAGDGNVTIVNGVSSYNAATSILDFEDINYGSAGATNVNFSIDGANLNITTGTAGTVTIEGWFAGSFAQLSGIDFADGVVVSGTDVQYLANTYFVQPGTNTTIWDFAASNLGIEGSNAWAQSGNTLSGGDGDDVLAGNGQSNTFLAGGGNDTIYGGGGSDTYDMNAAGQLTIKNNATETDTLASGAVKSGTLEFTGLTFSQLRFSQTGNDLTATVVGTSTTATVSGWFINDCFELNNIQTSDETTIGYTDGNNYLSGSTAANGYGIYSNENYYLTGTTSFGANLYETTAVGGNSANFLWEHDLGYSDGTTNDTVIASNVANILYADTLSATGTGDTLIATPSGTSTLIGSFAGDTLESGTGTGIADYSQNNITVTLTAGAATSTLGSDSLVGIDQVMASGSSETLIGWAGATLIAAGASDALQAGGGTEQLRGYVDGDTLTASTLTGAVAQAYYGGDGVAVNLAAGTASEAGGASDTLIGITVATVAGANDTLIGNSSISTLTAAGAGDTIVNGFAGSKLIATGADDTIEFGGAGTNTIVGSADGSTTVVLTTAGVAVSLSASNLTNISQAIADASNVTLTGLTSGTPTLSADATGDTLIAAGGTTQMFGYANGSTLEATTLAGSVTQAYYGDNNAVVNLATGGAVESGTGHASDTLVNFTVATVAGASDTLTGSSAHLGTLTAAGANDTLFNGYTGSTLIATGTNDTIDYGGGTTNIVVGNTNGSTTVEITNTGMSVSLSTSNLANINQAIAGANSVTLTGNSAADSLSATGNSDTLVGGGSGTTLSASGANDLIIYGGSSTSIFGDNSTILGLTTANQSVNLGAANFNNSIVNAIASASYITLTGSATAANILTSTGANDTLINGAAGSTLTATGANDEIMYQGASTNVINGDSAGDTTLAVTGSSVSVSLSGANVSNIDIATLVGSSDTLVGSTASVGTLTAAGASDTLINEYVGSTMIATGSNALVEYGGGTVNTVTGDAAGDTTIDITGSGMAVSLSASNLTNINRAIAGASNVTLTGNSGADIMVAASTSDTLIGGGAGTTLSASGANDSIIYGGATTTVIGDSSTILGLTTANQSVNLGAANFSNIVRAIAGASYITLTGGAAVSALTASGINNTLINGAAGSTLTATGSNDTLINGAADGSTLSATGSNDEIIYDGVSSNIISGDTVGDTTLAITGSGVNVSLSGANVTNVDLAVLIGSSDTLTGSTTAVGTLTAAGANDTLINEYVGSTMIATGSNALIEYGGGTVNIVTGDAAGDTTIYITGSGEAVSLSASNLTNINRAIAATSSVTLTGNSGADIMVAASTSDTLIGGGAGTTLSASGSSDSIIYGGSSTTTVIGDSTTIMGVTTANVNIDLATATNISGITHAIIGASDITLTGGTAASALTETGSSDTLINGAAGSTLTATGSNDEIMYQGATSNIINGASAGDTTLAVTGSSVSVGLSTSNITNIHKAVATGSNDVLTGLASATTTLSSTSTGDTLDSGAGGGTLMESGASSAYDYTSGDGSEIIINGSGGSTASNHLAFGSGFTDEKLWFVHTGNNLVVDVLGTSKSVTIENWFSSTGSQLNQVTANGLTITTGVAALVTAMANYAAAHTSFNPVTATTMPTDTTLQNAITTNWHS